ncbi:hypothetical protein [Zhongshania sp.]|uniref:hypothetical protein n=1 Tax=Zhongshania sp. TaxID=1971902 RepID=UPI003561BF94
MCLLKVADEVINVISPNERDALDKFMKIPAKDKLHSLCRELLLVLDDFQIYRKFKFSAKEF